MRLTLAEPKYLKESISIISELVNETQLKITKDGLELVAMDPANVAMVIFKLFSSSFTEYEIGTETAIGLNLANVKQILRRAGPSDMITLELENGKLMIQLRSKSTRTFQLPIIDLEEREQRIPELSFPVKIEMASTALNEAIDDVDIVGESVSFVGELKKFGLQAEGDSSNANIEIKASDDTKIDCKSEKPIKAKYSVEYLKKMIAGSKISDKVTIQFNRDYPLKLDYHTIDRVMLSFILAPRVEND